jgi:hypothetical protein
MGNFVFQDLNRFGQVWRENDPPLVNGAEPLVAPSNVSTDAPDSAPRRTPWWATLWYLTHLSIVGAALITLASAPPESYYALPTWQAIPLGCALALLLWGITLAVRARTRPQETP